MIVKAVAPLDIRDLRRIMWQEKFEISREEDASPEMSKHPSGWTEQESSMSNLSFRLSGSRDCRSIQGW